MKSSPLTRDRTPPTSVNSADRFDIVVLALLLAMIPLRTLLHETQSQETPSNTRRLEAPSGPTPATTLVMDGLIFASAVTVATRRIWKGSDHYKWTGAEAGVLLLLMAGAVSTCFASNKRTAMVGAIDLAALLTYLLLLRQLIRRPWQSRLALCVLLATGTMAAYKCVAQVAWEFPETIRQYEIQFKQQMREGTLSPGTQHDFEQRLKGQAASAFFAHPNVAGTCLAAMSLLGIGVAAARRQRAGRIGMIAPLVLSATAAWAMFLTQSKGAAAAWAGGLVLWVIWRFCRDALRARPRLGLMMFWVAAFSTLSAVAIYGLSRGGLPTLSMLYRWQYWRAAAGMADVVSWHGVGANNFGTYFTRYKPVECPEDVQDPHSWIVRIAVEWGPIGLLGMLAVWVGLSTRLAGRKETLLLSPLRDDPPRHRSMLLWLLIIAGVVAFGYLWVYRDALRVPEHAAFILLNLMEMLTVWGIAFALLSIESREVATLSDEPLGDLRPGLVIAAMAFLLHASVDMAMSASAAVMILVTLLATALSTTGHAAGITAQPKSKRAIMILLIGLAVLTVYSSMIVRPVVQAAMALDAARRAPIGNSRAEFEQSGAWSAYLRAIAADPMDRAAVDELLDELLSDPPRIETTHQVDEALRWTEELRRRDPESARADTHATRLYVLRHAMTGDVADLRQAIDALSRCIGAYPTSPDRRLSLGRLLARWSALTNDGEAGRRAARELRIALDLDGMRTYISTPHRITAEQIAEIQAEIVRLERPLGSELDRANPR